MRRDARFPQSRWAGRALIVLALSLGCATAWAGMKKITSKPHNHDEAPIIVKRSKVTMIETYPNPNQVATTGSKTRYSRVKYANRGGQTQTVNLLQGELLCRNKSRKNAKTLGLRIVLMDAFHEQIFVRRSSGRSELEQIEIDLTRGAERRIRWEQEGPSDDVYEVAVIIERILFKDGSVWKAPKTEIVDIF